VCARAGKLIKEENVTLEEAKLVDGQSLLIEVRLDDGSWPRDGIKKRKSSTSGKDKLIDGTRPDALLRHPWFVCVCACTCSS
jgi:hypothetical protein